MTILHGTAQVTVGDGAQMYILATGYVMSHSKARLK